MRRRRAARAPRRRPAVVPGCATSPGCSGRSARSDRVSPEGRRRVLPGRCRCCRWSPSRTDVRRPEPTATTASSSRSQGERIPAPPEHQRPARVVRTTQVGQRSRSVAAARTACSRRSTGVRRAVDQGDRRDGGPTSCHVLTRPTTLLPGIDTAVRSALVKGDARDLGAQIPQPLQNPEQLRLVTDRRGEMSRSRRDSDLAFGHRRRQQRAPLIAHNDPGNVASARRGHCALVETHASVVAVTGMTRHRAALSSSG